MAYLTLEDFKTIHQEWKQSGLSVREYCDTIGMKESKFYYWKQKTELEQNTLQCGSFVPVKINNGIRSGIHPGTAPSSQGALCEVVYPNGVTVRVTSDMTLEQLRQMITLFR